MDSPYIVYVKTDSNNHIIAVNSSAFLLETSDWVEIDSGFGDKFHHAQCNYFPAPIFTDGGAYRYRLAEGVIVECTADEIAEQEASMRSEQNLSQEERIRELELQNEMLTQCILELSEVVYA